MDSKQFIINRISQESTLNSPQLFDQYFEELINVGIAIYSNDISVMSKTKQLEYLRSLKRIQNPKHWRNNSIFRGTILRHIEEISGFDPTKENIKKFINYKLMQISRLDDDHDEEVPCLGNFYHKKIIESGIDINTLEFKLQIFKKRKRDNCISEGTTNTSSSSSQHHQMCDNDKCCLCGNREKVTTVPSTLYDVAMKHYEYYSGSVYEEDDPFLVCAFCKCSLQVISSFCLKIQTHFQKLKKQCTSTLVITNVKHINSPPSPPPSSLSSEPHIEFNNNSIESNVLPTYNKVFTDYNERYYDASDELNIFCEVDNIMEIENNENQPPPVASDDQTSELDLNQPSIAKRNTIQDLLSQCKDCSVSLLRLPIVWVPSDTESESDVEDNEEEDEIFEENTPDDFFIPKRVKPDLNLCTTACLQEIDEGHEKEDETVPKKINIADPKIKSPVVPNIRVRNLSDLL